MQIKKILVLIIANMLIATTPLVLAASEDSVIITFDPDGDIDIDISLASYNFSSVQANDWSNSTEELLLFIIMEQLQWTQT